MLQYVTGARLEQGRQEFVHQEGLAKNARPLVLDERFIVSGSRCIDEHGGTDIVRDPATYVRLGHVINVIGREPFGMTLFDAEAR